MFKKLLLVLTVLFTVQLTSAQILLNDNFDNYTLGNLGTDVTGVVPGQGNWLTEILYAPLNHSSSAFNITNEAFKGKVLTFTTPQGEYMVAKKDLSTFINQRTTGNDVIKVEIDYYTGTQYYMATNRAPYITISLHDNNNKRLLMIYHNIVNKNFIYARSLDDFGTNNVLKLGNDSGNVDSLPVNTWISFIVYLDYNNRKAYVETPYFNKVAVGDFLSKSTSNNLIEDFKPVLLSLYADAAIANASQMVHKFDNIKITGLKVVPPNIIALSINEQLATKFNVFPNPANNIVNITNRENISVEQIHVFDISGKTVQSYFFNKENQVQLNIENLASGTYMLHIKTIKGVAVKKIIKSKIQLANDKGNVYLGNKILIILIFFVAC